MKRRHALRTPSIIAARLAQAKADGLGMDADVPISTTTEPSRDREGVGFPTSALMLLESECKSSV
jgi:hypothetical protein